LTTLLVTNPVTLPVALGTVAVNTIRDKLVI
jgi:hypothetical protein